MTLLKLLHDIKAALFDMRDEKPVELDLLKRCMIASFYMAVGESYRWN